MNQNKNSVAVIYARYSSDMQREESIEAQIRACKYYAQKEGVSIVRIYADRAKSGKWTKGRDQFLKMIEDSKSGEFQTVLVHKLNRFGRDSLDTLQYKKELERNGVALTSVTEKLDNTPEGKLMLMVIAGMNEFYSANLSNEVMKGLTENALQGKHTGGQPPLGYDVDNDTKKLVINPREAEAVKLIFSMYLDGCTYSQIIELLNERGFKTKAGNPFANNSLHTILNNPKYTGVFTYSRLTSKDVDGKRNSHSYKEDDEIIKVEDAVPALISKKDFEKAQERMKERKRKPGRYRAKRTYLLSGKVFCGECGTPYVGNCRSSHNGTSFFVSYRCNNRAKRPRCDGWEIRGKTLEGIVLGELAGIVFNDNMIPKLANGYRQYLMEQNTDALAMQDELTRQIIAVQKDMDSIMSVIIQTSSDALVSKLNALDAHKQELIRKLHKAQAECNIEGPSEEELSMSFKMARKMLKSGELPTVEALIERYVHNVIISGDNIEIQFNLNISSRVVTYSANPYRKEIPQPSGQEVTEVFTFVPTAMLATHGGAGEN